jgi:hypothetical protein
MEARMPNFRLLGLEKLTITDEASFGHVGLYRALKAAIRRDGFQFRVPAKGATWAAWDRVLFLNLTFWSAADATDVLVDDTIPADTVCHAAWHHLARTRLIGAELSSDALFLGEAIASAFDVYLVGRLLGHSLESDFLATQVPAMSEAAAAGGLDEDGFEALLAQISADPDRAFEDLRSLLFDAASSLVRCDSLDAAVDAFAKLEGRRFAPLLHHFELSNWVLYARAYAKTLEPDPAVREVDAALRAAPSSLEWLESRWLAGVDA